jgi:hypothetical protein
MRKFFNYLFKRSSNFLFLSAILSSTFLILSFFYLGFNYPEFLFNETNIIKDEAHSPRFQDFTLLGKFYLFSGIIPNSLFLILIYRMIKFLLVTFLLKFILVILLQFVGRILGIIFSDRNLDSFNKFVSKLEKTLIKQKPKVDKILKKKIKKDYLMPISIVTAATILALAILFQ